MFGPCARYLVLLQKRPGTSAYHSLSGVGSPLHVFAGTITLSPQTWTAPSGTVILSNRKVMIEGGAHPRLSYFFSSGCQQDAVWCGGAWKERLLLQLFQCN